MTNAAEMFINWSKSQFRKLDCLCFSCETRKPQNLEECLRGVQGVPLESSVNDCSESCRLVGLH